MFFQCLRRIVWKPYYRLSLCAAAKGVSPWVTIATLLRGGGNKDGAVRTYSFFLIKLHSNNLKKSVFCHGQSADFFYSTKKCKSRPGFTCIYNLLTDKTVRLPCCRSPPPGFGFYKNSKFGGKDHEKLQGK